MRKIAGRFGWFQHDEATGDPAMAVLAIHGMGDRLLPVGPDTSSGAVRAA
jgi:hypothetical protein